MKLTRLVAFSLGIVNEVGAMDRGGRNAGCRRRLSRLGSGGTNRGHPRGTHRSTAVNGEVNCDSGRRTI